jgi:hypothetical protein
MAVVSPQEGEGWLSNCPNCDELTILVQCEGLTTRLTRQSVPYNDARVLSKHRFSVWNCWRRMWGVGFYVMQWYASYGRPDDGRLYLMHDCSIRK